MYEEKWELRGDNWIIEEGANPKDADIDLGKAIVVGTFVNIEKPTFLEQYWAQMPKREAPKPNARKVGEEVGE